jgi:peptidyl-prolyl cis-trans isomerase SurA
MKYLYTVIPGLLSGILAIAQTPHKVEADKIVGIVGDKIILKSDVSNEILDRRRHGDPAGDNNDECNIMEQLLTFKALVLQAEKDSIEIAADELDAAIDNRIRYFIRMHGSPQALVDMSGRSIFQLKQDFRQPIKERMLSDRLSMKITGNVKITPQEVKTYFAGKKTDNLPFYESAVEIGEIVVYPKAGRELEELEMQELTDLKKQVESGKQQFHILARLYSEDKLTKERGGELSINRTEKVTDYPFVDPSFMNQVFRMKQGQVSPIFKTKAGYHIVQLVSRSGDDAVVRHIMRVPKITEKEINEGINKLDSVRSRIIAGTATFGEAVAKYSEGDTKLSGGFRLNEEGTTLLQLDQLEKELVLMLDQTKMKQGELSKPVPFTDASGKQGVRIVFLKTRSAPHRQNLKDDYDRVADEALIIKKQKVIETWFASKIPSYYVMITPEYNKCSTLRTWMQYATTEKK